MAAREKVADKNVATTELAAVLGISARRVQQLAQDGILDTVERGKFELSAAVQAYIRFLGRDAMTEEDKKLESAKRKAEATLKLSKAKIAKAQADELSGQMHRSEDVAAMTADLIYTIRGALMAFPGRVAIDAAAITDAAEEAEYLRKEVNILCAQLAQYRYDPKAYEARVPYESPSNKDAKIDGLCLADGTAVVLTFEQANALNGGGIVTALNFMGAWKVWGNYTGCYPSNTDPKDMFISCGRMFAYVQNTIIRTCWQFLDKPMNRRLLDTITDTVNIWLNGLVGSGYLLGARVEISEDENPVTQLMAGIIKIHVYMTPASPAQEIDFVLEYDSSYVTSALTA